MGVPGEVTQLLAQAREGDDTAATRVFELLYRDMRRIAARWLGRERSGHTLQPTALVHEAYLRIFGDRPPAFEDRAHFLSIASRVMRRLLVDHARGRNSAKRGLGFAAVTFDDHLLVAESDWPKFLHLDEAMNRLEVFDPRQCRVVEMRFFGGLSEDEIACALGVSVRTVKRDWEHARAWLYDQLAG